MPCVVLGCAVLNAFIRTSVCLGMVYGACVCALCGCVCAYGCCCCRYCVLLMMIVLTEMMPVAYVVCASNTVRTTRLSMRVLCTYVCLIEAVSNMENAAFLIYSHCDAIEHGIMGNVMLFTLSADWSPTHRGIFVWMVYGFHWHDLSMEHWIEPGLRLRNDVCAKHLLQWRRFKFCRRATELSWISGGGTIFLRKGHLFTCIAIAREKAGKQLIGREESPIKISTIELREPGWITLTKSFDCRTNELRSLDGRLPWAWLEFICGSSWILVNHCDY